MKTCTEISVMDQNINSTDASYINTFPSLDITLLLVNAYSLHYRLPFKKKNLLTVCENVF